MLIRNSILDLKCDKRMYILFIRKPLSILILVARYINVAQHSCSEALTRLIVNKNRNISLYFAKSDSEITNCNGQGKLYTSCSFDHASNEESFFKIDSKLQLKTSISHFVFSRLFDAAPRLTQLATITTIRK